MKSNILPIGSIAEAVDAGGDPCAHPSPDAAGSVESVARSCVSSFVPLMVLASVNFAGIIQGALQDYGTAADLRRGLEQWSEQDPRKKNALAHARTRETEARQALKVLCESVSQFSEGTRRLSDYGGPIKGMLFDSMKSDIQTGLLGSLRGLPPDILDKAAAEKVIAHLAGVLGVRIPSEALCRQEGCASAPGSPQGAPEPPPATESTDEAPSA